MDKDKLMKKVNLISEQIRRKYIYPSVTLKVKRIWPAAEELIEFLFTYNDRPRYFLPNNIVGFSNVEKEEKEEGLYHYLLSETSKGIFSYVGNWMIQEAENPHFASERHYGKEEFEKLHQSEDTIAEIAQAMYIGSQFSELDESVDCRYPLLYRYSSEELKTIAMVAKTVAKSTGFEIVIVNYEGFSRPLYDDGRQVQMVEIGYRRPNSQNICYVRLFGNVAVHCIDKFKKNGFDENQAFYSLILNYLSSSVKKLSVSDDADIDKKTLLQMEQESMLMSLNSLPKYYSNL